MSISDDDDDFLSADEDCFVDDEKKESKVVETNSELDKDLNSSSKRTHEQDEGETKVISGGSKDIKTGEHGDATETNKAKGDLLKQEAQEESVNVEENTEARSKADKTNNDDDDDAQTEGVSLRRIRERNLKLARKYSAEIAKNVKASAPIPIKTTAPADFKITDDDSATIADSRFKGSMPPAPPPTPALSSSFNSDEQPNETPTSLYSWRVPIKIQKVTTASSSSPSLSKQDTEKQEQPAVSGLKSTDTKTEQARLTLDRLSEKLSQPDKNLFEKVAEDLKKVSISQEPTSGNSSDSLPIIPSLSSTFSGWNWSSATKILASASQVTSQVSSVLDSAVGATQHFQLSSTVGHKQGEGNEASELTESDANNSKTNKQVKSNSEEPKMKKPTGEKASMSASDALSNDALVDFTLNAMESLGKKAFGVMTERDESGSLQIKGIGRPWEHLLNAKKSLQSKGQQQQKLNSQSTSSAAELKDYSQVDDYEDVDSRALASEKTSGICSGETGGNAALKNRRRRDYQSDENYD